MIAVKHALPPTSPVPTGTAAVISRPRSDAAHPVGAGP